MLNSCDCDCDGGFGLGWIFPAFLLGKIISHVFESPQGSRIPVANPVGQPESAAPAPVVAAHAEPRPAARCHSCAGIIHPDFTFCPHCGKKVMPSTCRYCGQALKPEMRYCAHCGGPAQ